MNKEINIAFMRLSKRAEGVERAKLVETFVDIGPLFTLLSSRDHQVFYGRRGTGKTHALVFLASTLSEAGDLPVYVDMRTIGSTGGLYADPQVPIPERATRLLMDTLGALHDGLLEHVLNRNDINLAQVGPLLDALADAATEVTVVGQVETEEAQSSRKSQSSASEVGIHISAAPEIAGDVKSSRESSRDFSQSIKRSGNQYHRVHFGRVGQALHRLLDALSGRRIWLLLDEWSAVPAELQPYLADLLRRSLFPLHGVTVKVAAIEQRTNLRLIGTRGDYIGIELGADAAANVNLDDYMVFENDPERATLFFQELLFKHFVSVVGSDSELDLRTASRLISAAFTQKNTFEEFVRAAEGVPRDAINILSLAAQRATEDPISIENVRAASRAWYQRDKEAAVAANSEAQALLHWVIDKVIAHRRARAFLLRADAQHELIDALFDARVLHLLKRSISTHDQPGIRYDSYKIDYGCYVDLLTTGKAPLGLLPSEDQAFVEVPPDDYRAIRRAILDLGEFQSQRTGEGSSS
jgi:hypothetical protein